MIERLSWDSDFFGFEVGKIHVNSCVILSSEKFTTLSVKYKLIYIFSATELVHAALKLVDTKVVFQKKINSNNIYFMQDIVPIHEMNVDLEELVYLSGIYSRFKLDENFSEDSFKSLYLIWITNSLNDPLNSRVLVKLRDAKIVGFVSVKIKDEKGVIELISVSRAHQGLNIGSELIQAAEMFCIEKNIETIEVATQFENFKANSFYKSNHFEPISTTFVYHKWSGC